MIGIVDYGVGNVLAFANVYKRMNIPFTIVSNAADVADVDKLILPGVGSFDFAMTRLIASGMREAMDRAVLENGVSVLGICVGMQMLAREGALVDLLESGARFDFGHFWEDICFNTGPMISPAAARELLVTA